MMRNAYELIMLKCADFDSNTAKSCLVISRRPPHRLDYN